MSLSDAALGVLRSLWAEREESFADAYLGLMYKYRTFALSQPAYVLAHGLPWQDDLRALIEQGTTDGAASMLGLFAQEAGLTGGTAAIMQTIADHYAAYAPVLAGDMDGGLSDTARRAAQVALQGGMGERDAAQLLLSRYGTLGAARARTVARTELTNGATLARIGAHAATGLTRFEYRAVLDDRTTDVCQGLEGVVLDMLDPVARQLCPANHYRCRALLVPAAPGAPGAPPAALRRHLAARRAAFPGWESRLSPVVAALVGVRA